MFLQQVIALFVLKTGAGFSIFKWIATLAGDFLDSGLAGAAFFFDADTVATKHWFFVNTVCDLFSVVLCKADSEKTYYYIAVDHHLFRGFRPDDVLLGRHAMGYQVLVSKANISDFFVQPKYANSAWFFFKIMNVSGAEAVVAAASPWIGQGESACLVRPYVDRTFGNFSTSFCLENDSCIFSSHDRI